MPEDAATARELRGGTPNWSLEAHLLDNVRVAVQQLAHGMSGGKGKAPKPHPSRPQNTGRKRKQSPERRRKLAAARARAHARRRAIEAGEIT